MRSPRPIAKRCDELNLITESYTFSAVSMYYEATMLSMNSAYSFCIFAGFNIQASRCSTSSMICSNFRSCTKLLTNILKICEQTLYCSYLLQRIEVPFVDSEKTDKNQTTILRFQCITSHMADITSRMTDICRKHPPVSNGIAKGKGNLWI